MLYIIRHTMCHLVGYEDTTHEPCSEPWSEPGSEPGSKSGNGLEDKEAKILNI